MKSGIKIRQSNQVFKLDIQADNRIRQSNMTLNFRITELQYSKAARRQRMVEAICL